MFNIKYNLDFCFFKDPAPFDPFLPLHYFDDTDFEIWTPQTWLALGHDPFTGLNKPLPGIALLPDVPQSEIRMY